LPLEQFANSTDQQISNYSGGNPRTSIGWVPDDASAAFIFQGWVREHERCTELPENLLLRM